MLTLTSNPDKLSLTNKNNDDIFFITQFFIHKNESRYNEIKTCLRKNIELNIFKKIILLNERNYSHDELGITEEQYTYVLQININKRLTYRDVFCYVRHTKLHGYIVFSNADIFFDNSILNVRKSCLSTSKSIYSLLRYEYTDSNLNKCILFNDISQDTWIFHTSKLIYNNMFFKRCNFYFGLPACDHKINYLFYKYGYKCYNVPENIKTYHFHLSQQRDYTNKDSVRGPYLCLKHNS